MSLDALPRCSRLPLAPRLPALLEALGRIPDDAWQHHFNTGYYQGEWSGVALITPEDALLPLAPGQGEPVPTDWWQEEQAWHQVLALFQTNIRSARLLRLGAGARIHEHCDPDLGQPGGDLRLHMPLLSPADVEFLVDGLQVPMKVGECWFVDLSRPHRVDNPGPGARVHLVLDCQPNAWLLELLHQGISDTPELSPGRAGLAFATFRDHVAGDPNLAERLRTITDPHLFCEAVVRLGHEQGLEFSEADVKGAMRQGKRTWNDQWRA
ncbi:aspartyl/asparaginyl beta-hydroxylase domain-containing protein [Pseudomonas toyotomiensis]|uniref:Aspartyl/asparaginyl beta-hydroxylase domain-containing protein n=1 Tax=Ectopseudomonas toyotomiensis TaxID=554344 RepID=A0AA42LH07_9GAMM|nr:aspartyl/asparaginyl beta-hydroxylase domain-containing protein [Pseudomonas toyotomiensis]MDH0700669.1 aspartyl/asparaginyl beta-hydroxylase domain-containing protein [Pseudomonas toyotomiensis]